MFIYNDDNHYYTSALKIYNGSMEENPISTKIANTA